MNIEGLKKGKFRQKVYAQTMKFLKAYMPFLRAKIAYQIAYGKKCNLKNPQTFSEKMLWLSLHTYRNNPLVLALCDKYKVRRYVAEKAGKEFLNEVYCVFAKLEDISYDKLPDSFALKISQGCTTNLFCKDKKELTREALTQLLATWGQKQYLYDKMMADIGGVTVDKLDKCYICEKYLTQNGHLSPTDYKIYCFNGEPTAILVISDRFEHKTGLFMSTDWNVLSKLSAPYRAPAQIYEKPKSFKQMLQAARQLSKGFPFVRVDMYDIDGKAIFGEMTFFPNGCISMQETTVNGKTMGELLDITAELKKLKEGKIK